MTGKSSCTGLRSSDHGVGSVDTTAPRAKPLCGRKDRKSKRRHEIVGSRNAQPTASTWPQLWSQLSRIRLPGRPDAGVQVARAVRFSPMKPVKLLIGLRRTSGVQGKSAVQGSGSRHVPAAPSDEEHHLSLVDGQRFIGVPRGSASSDLGEIYLVTDWFEELRARMGVRDWPIRPRNARTRLIGLATCAKRSIRWTTRSTWRSIARGRVNGAGPARQDRPLFRQPRPGGVTRAQASYPPGRIDRCS